MASYKASYKVLRQQGEDIKAVAKLVDGYSERVVQISNKLGSDELLAQVRSNLNKLKEQLTESRTVLNTAGEFIVKTVEGYSNVEVRQVKKVDATKAHNRDFYKNPVVVASAGGGAAAGAATAAAASANPSTTLNYIDNSVNISYTQAESASVANPVTAGGAAASAAQAPSVAAAGTAQTAKATLVSAGMGAAGGIVGAGAVLGAKHLLDKDKKENKGDYNTHKPDDAEDYDPELELEKAIRRVKRLEDEE